MATKTTRTRAHTAAELAKAMGITAEQCERARAAGLIPAPDMKTPRWSGPLVDDLVARASEIVAALPDDLSQEQLREALDMTWGDWCRARDAGLIAAADRGSFWTRSLADDMIARMEDIRAATPPQPLGAARCAALLSEAVGVEVTIDDFKTLVKAGHTEAVDSYKKWNLYDVAKLKALIATEQGRQIVAGVAGDRQAWMSDSLAPEAAALFLGWNAYDFDQLAAEHELKPGRFGRYSRLDLARLAGDEELVERVRRNSLLGPEQAARHMEVRRVDFDALTELRRPRPACPPVMGYMAS
ncbi:hypothetical protein [Nonomuraea jabiensis]|uniref:hypothetical protein n=1 Tax=Nonomuraea jabiensis TaxID=882448 RepID=UPI003D73898F